MKTHIRDISLFEILGALWRRWWLIILLAVTLGGASFSYNRFLVPRSYTSTTRLYVVNKTEGAVVSNQDLQAGSALTKDYREIILSEDVIDQTIADLGLNVSQREFISKLQVSVPADTRIISISVTNTEPEEAARIANALRQLSAEKIKAVTQVSDVTTLQEGRVPTRPSGPNSVRAGVLGAVLGAVLVILGIITKEVLDDRVKRLEDLEKMNLTLLGSLPFVKEEK